jgi:hypothetical protein
MILLQQRRNAVITEALDRAERTVRNEGADEYWYIDPNQFAYTESDERDEMASGDPEVDIRIETEDEAKDIAKRLAVFLGHRVIVQKFVKAGAMRDNFEGDASSKITVMPWSN